MSQKISRKDAVLEFGPDGSVSVRKRGKPDVIATIDDGSTIRLTAKAVTIIGPDDDPVEDDDEEGAE